MKEATYNHLKLDNFTSFRSDVGRNHRRCLNINDLNKENVSPTAVNIPLFSSCNENSEIPCSSNLSPSLQTTPFGDVSNTSQSSLCSTHCVPVAHIFSQIHSIGGKSVDEAKRSKDKYSMVNQSNENGSIRSIRTTPIAVNGYTTPLFLYSRERLPFSNISNNCNLNAGKSKKESSTRNLKDPNLKGVCKRPTKNKTTLPGKENCEAPTLPLNKKSRRRIDREIIKDTSSQLFHPQHVDDDETLEHSAVGDLMNDDDGLFNDDGYDYDELIEAVSENKFFASDSKSKSKGKPVYCTLGPPTAKCDKCNAIMWKEERINKKVKNGTPEFALCCGKGSN